MRLNLEESGSVCPSASDSGISPKHPVRISRALKVNTFNTLKWFIVLQEMNNVDKVFTIGKDFVLRF